MAEGVETQNSSDIIYDFYCELCIEDGWRIGAEGFCSDCSEYLCGTCYNAHTRTRATRHHVMQDKGHMPTDTPLSADRVSKDIATKCKVHQGEQVKYYCTNHADFACNACFVSGHKTCSNIDSIIEISENILESKVYKDFLTKLQMLQGMSRDIMERARDNKTVSRVCFTNVVSSVKQIKEEAIVALNELEQNIVTLAEKMTSENEEKMSSVEEKCQVMAEQIKTITAEFESLESSKRVCQIYILMREKEDEVQTLQTDVLQLNTANVITKFTFSPNAELTSYLRNPDALGKITQQSQQANTSCPEATKISDNIAINMTSLPKHPDAVEKVTHQDQQVHTPYTVVTLDPVSIKATRVRDIILRSNSYSCRCGIFGSAVVSESTVIFTDWYKEKVKLLDTHTNTLLSELQDPSRPWDVTLIHQSQAAVTLPERSRILLVKLSDRLAREREITVHGKCRGVAYSQCRLLVTFVDNNNPRLEIMDLHGNVTRTIQTGSDGSKLFTMPCYVCVSKADDVIYVSDADRVAVTSLRFDVVLKVRLHGPGAECTSQSLYRSPWTCLRQWPA